MEWIRVEKELPPSGTVVDTKIDDMNGARNEQQLVRNANLWFHPDGKMYVYYKPTHWKFPEPPTHTNQ
jgi:hypothetical protein